LDSATFYGFQHSNVCTVLITSADDLQSCS